jgi:hypothetical protein
MVTAALTIFGLPQKDGNDKALYDYERIIFDILVAQDNNSDAVNKHLWIKKATGLGISEFMLRFMSWLCLKDNNYQIHKGALSQGLE